ncbi:MAG: amino acid permease, partial [Planctomycetota bacterium]|nr:amino acid permease [Planctomycetota bacterium]
SGIFATPGEIAKSIASPWGILFVWILCGGITLMPSLVTAELATRFPKAGGEYQYLKEAYGEFAAFFFGWSATVFVIGAGGGTIAAALGDFAADLLGLRYTWASPALGCAGLIAVTILNALGLRAGAITQNLLTTLKVVALLAIGVGAMIVSQRFLPVAAPATERSDTAIPFGVLVLAALPAFWSFTGTTDSARLAEEIKDVHRALPRALLGSALLITIVYVIYNYALLCALSPAEMAGQRSVPALIFEGSVAGKVIVLASVLICLGAVSACMLANVRVTYALARDGLTFRFLSRMSRNQAPVGALVLGAAIACFFVLNRSFPQILRIYFLASAVLFGLTYLSLIVFRVRDRRAGRSFPRDAFKAPGGVVISVVLIAMEIAIAVYLVAEDVRSWSGAASEKSYDSLYTLAVLAAMALFYLVWKWATRGSATRDAGRGDA